MDKTKYYAFYATLLYGEYDSLPRWIEVPDGVYIFHDKFWYRKDRTPVFLEDVPKPIRALALLMGLN